MDEIVECPKCGNLIEGEEAHCNQCGFDRRKFGSELKQEKITPTEPVYSSVSATISTSKQELLNQTIKADRNTNAGKNNIVLVVLTVIAVFLVVYMTARSSSVPWPLYVMLGLIAPFSITGYYVGRRTGNALEGIWFGALLGPLGIVIAFALEEKDRERCVMCGEKIYAYAQVCPHCGDKKS